MRVTHKYKKKYLQLCRPAEMETATTQIYHIQKHHIITDKHRNAYLGAVDGGVVLHVLLHGHADVGGGQGALGVAQLVQGLQRVEARVRLELGDLVAWGGRERERDEW